MAQTFTQSKCVHQTVEPCTVHLLARQSQGHHDVLLGREHRQQIEALEDETDVVAAQQRELLVVELRQVAPLEHDAAAGGRVQTAHHMHQRRFSGSGRSHNRREPALLELHVDIFQRMHQAFTRAIVLHQIDGLDRHRRMGRLVNLVNHVLQRGIRHVLSFLGPSPLQSRALTCISANICPTTMPTHHPQG